MITDCQAQIIYTIVRECGYQAGESFLPAEIFTGKDDASRMIRRELLGMLGTGLVEKRLAGKSQAGIWLQAPYGRIQRCRLMLTRKALKEYDLWAQRKAVGLPQGGKS